MEVIGENEDAKIPSTFARLAREAGFKSLSYLGEGGFGITVRAKATDGSLRVLKMQKAANSIDDAALDEVREEAKHLRMMRHPHIVQFFGLTKIQNTLVIDMALMPGGSLWERIFTSSIGVHTTECLKWMSQLASALHYIHDTKKLAHRDVKSENTLLTGPHGDAKLADFGLCKDAQRIAQEQVVDLFAGTPNYQPNSVHLVNICQ